MAHLSLTQAWNEAAAFVKREARLIVPVAFMLVVLPPVLLSLFVPQTSPLEPPQPGPWLLAVPVILVLGLAGNIAICRLVLRAGISVGEALSHGFRRMPALLGAVLLLSLAAFLLLVVVSIVALAVGGSGPAPSGGAIALMLLLALPVLLYFGVRFIVTTPAAAAESGGSLALLRRSWRLTAGHVWTLIGFVLLVALLSLVVSLAAGLVFGLIIVALAGPPAPGTVSGVLALLVSAAVRTLVTVYATALVARVYAQLAGEPTSGI